MNRLVSYLPAAAFAIAILGACAEEQPKMVIPVAGAVTAQDIQARRTEAVAKMKAAAPSLSDRAVQAFLDVPRENFIIKTAFHRAYEDRPLPIGNGAYTLRLSEIAFLLAQLDIRENDAILEVGTGTGYLTAILAKLGKSVYSLENNEYLRDYAYDYFRNSAQKSVHVKGKNGLKNWQSIDGDEDGAIRYTFDVIVITAAIREIPGIILRQLNPDARLAVPLIGENRTEWVVYHWKDGALVEAARCNAMVDEARYE